MFRCPLFLSKENHAIEAWLKKGFADAQKREGKARRKKESAERPRLRAASNKCVTGRSIISALVRRLFRLGLCPIAHGKRKATSHKNTRLILFRLFFQSGTPLVSCPKIPSAISMAERARQAANKSFYFVAPPPKFRTSFCKMILVRYYRLFPGDRIKKMSVCAFSPRSNQTAPRKDLRGAVM